MAKRIVTAVVVVLVLLGGYYAWMRYRAESQVRNGDVLTADGSDPNTPDTTASTPTPAPAKPKQTNTVSPSAGELQSQNSPAPTALPASDSLVPNSPNGAAFAGTGRFQVYRQGNLTWRVNTDNGSTCILFATDEEWRKPVVYNHGCGNS